MYAWKRQKGTEMKTIIVTKYNDENEEGILDYGKPLGISLPYEEEEVVYVDNQRCCRSTYQGELTGDDARKLDANDDVISHETILADDDDETWWEYHTDRGLAKEVYNSGGGVPPPFDDCTFPWRTHAPTRAEVDAEDFGYDPAPTEFWSAWMDAVKTASSDTAMIPAWNDDRGNGGGLYVALFEEGE